MSFAALIFLTSLANDLRSSVRGLFLGIVMYPVFSHQFRGLDFWGVTSTSIDRCRAASANSSTRGACTLWPLANFLPSSLVFVESRFAGQTMVFPSSFKEEIHRSSGYFEP